MGNNSIITICINKDKVHQGAEVSANPLAESFFAMSTMDDVDTNFRKFLVDYEVYELVWYTDVAAGYHHFIDSVGYSVSVNQILLTLPGQVYRPGPPGASGYRMAITKDFFEATIGSDIRWLVSRASGFSVVIPPRSFRVVNMLMELIQMEYRGDRRSAILGAYLRCWFLHCTEAQKGRETIQTDDPRLRLIAEIVDRNYRRQHQVAFYAKGLCVSAKRLNEICRKSFGKTISQLINDRLILEAKRELANLQKPIKEISYELGFTEPSYFTRFFRKQTDCSPQDFRKKIASLK